MNNIEKYAELFQILCEHSSSEKKLGKKATQKMFYFFERKGLNLNLRYGIHFFGPYSAKLDNVMHILESEDILSIDYSGVTHVITMGSEHISDNSLNSNERDIANEVIDTFFNKSASELEALATMDFIANFILDKPSSKDSIIKRFKEIKADKFDSRVIEDTYDELVGLGYINAA